MASASTPENLGDGRAQFRDLEPGIGQSTWRWRCATLSVMRYIFSLFLAAVVCVPAFVTAQTNSAPDRRLDISEARQSRRQVADNAAIDESVRIRALGLYDQAVSLLETAAMHEAEAVAFDRERGGIARVAEALSEGLAQPERPAHAVLPENSTLDQVEDALARERSGLAANRSELRNVELLAEERASSRSDVSKRLGALDQERVVLADDLRSVSQMDIHPEVKKAERLLISVRHQAAGAEITKLRASLALIEEKGTLIPLEVDIAQRRVAASEQLVSELENQAYQFRRRENTAVFARIRQQCKEASERVPELEGIASETERLAEYLYGADGILAQSEASTKALLTTRKHLDELNRIGELTRRKYAAHGRGGSITRWWPVIPDGFPEPGAASSAVNRLEHRVPEVEHQLIVFEEQRSGASDLVRRTREALAQGYGEDIDPEVQRLTHDLLRQRRDLLDRLVQQCGRYSNELVENLMVSTYLSDEINRVEEVLYSHILWSRSVPKPLVPRFNDLKNAMLWVLGVDLGRSAENGDTRGQVKILPRDFICALLLVLLAVFRHRLSSRLKALATRVRDPERDAFRHTADALVTTVLLAAPAPLFLYLVSTVLARVDGSAYIASAAQALVYVAMTAGVMELTRQLFIPDGFTEAHLGWPASATRGIYGGLVWPQLIGLPFLYVALQLMTAGVRLSSPPFLQVYNNSLGRVTFVVGVMILGLAILGRIRPVRATGEDKKFNEAFAHKRWARYAFPAAGVYAYPIVLLAAVVPAILAIFGFYVTGLLLAYQMLRTLWLAVGLLIFGGLLHRWRQSTRPESAEGGEVVGGEDHAADVQVRQLFRFVLILVAAFGLFSIWSEALPMLEALKRVQIFPHVMIMDSDQNLGFRSGLSPVAERQAGEPKLAEAPSAAQADGTDSGSTDEAKTAKVESTLLTLWSLLEALIAAITVFVLARNIPGLFELMMRRRTRLDSGARIAFSTLVQYAITIIGTIVVFGLLGITWTNVQWLAAALTFGLGFGLQEIVANFVSGLILLAERPIRVGDVVTVGTLMGKVTRIQIRATTITLWDRSEMIVPNKEFITTKLVNWTLSDSKRRIEIPVRVTYGTDLELVKKTMVEVAHQHPNVLDEPAPHVLLLNFGDDAVQLELRFIVEFGKGLATKDEVQMSIDRVFRENGIEFALPQLSVKLPS